ncbi:hypothetical protein Gotur_004770 [Gossypium turneri]
MGWLDSTEVERIRYARAYIFEMIGGYLMLDLSRNLIHLSQNRRLPITTTIMSLVSLSIFTSSSEPPIYIPTHNEVPLVNYAIVEMHQTDRVLRQFRFRQSIPVTPEAL